MKTYAAAWSLILLCSSLAIALGGGMFESIVLAPLWSSSPPASFSIIQPSTGVPLQRFWIPVHTAITVFMLLSLVLTWRETGVRRLLLIALISYIIMRVWSGIFFIPEMLTFQEVPLDSSATAELSARVAAWTFWKLVPRTARRGLDSLFPVGPLLAEEATRAERKCVMLFD